MAQLRYMVLDVEETITFYTDQLGLELVEQFGPALAILRQGDLDLGVAGPMASASQPMPDGAKPTPGGWNRCVLMIENLAEKVDSLRSNGVVFRKDIVDGPGGKQILCEDPSGYAVELFEAH